MRCPICGYSHGWNGEGVVEGEHGPYWKLPIEMESRGYSERREDVHGCPQCGTLFMNCDRRGVAK